MKQEKMSAAKMHYEELMAILAALGMTLAEFEDQMEGESEEEGGEYEEPSEDEMEKGPMMEKKMPSPSKVAIIVAKMKNKKKA